MLLTIEKFLFTNNIKVLVFALFGKLFICPLILSITILAIAHALRDFEYFLPIPSDLQSFFSEIS